MSQEKREQVKQGNQHLKSAEKSLEEAGKLFKQAGDGATTKRIEKITKEAGEVRQEAEKKLSPEHG